MDLSKLYSSLERELQEMEVALKRNLQGAEDTLIDQINEHIIFTQGKRIRPALVFLASRINSNIEQDGRMVALATAVELIHTATLIHDDVVDEATIRRSQPTINKIWGNQIAILTGDSLYAKAMCILAKNVSSEIMQILAEATNKMCNAEIKQINSRLNFDLKERDYLEIIEGKTGSFMGACCHTGALLGGAPEKETAALQRYGLNFGIAFQIVDDCLDIVGEGKKTGKSLGSDLNEGKMTLPLIFLLKSLSGKERQKLICLLQNDRNTSNLAQINKMLRSYKAIDYSFNIAREYIDRAKDELEIFKDTPVRKSLSNLANWVVKRKHQ